MGYVQTVAPTSEPIDLEFAKNACKVTSNKDDLLIQSFIQTARSRVEGFLNQQLITATWQLTLDRFPSEIQPRGNWLEREYRSMFACGSPILLAHGPVQSVSSITYKDATGATQTWDSSKWQLDKTCQPARIMPAEGQTYPQTQSSTANAVTVTFVSGYGSAENVPPEAVTVMLGWINHWNRNRSAVTFGNSKELEVAGYSLLAPIRIKTQW